MASGQVAQVGDQQGGLSVHWFYWLALYYLLIVAVGTVSESVSHRVSSKIQSAGQRKQKHVQAP
jgi:hypothetical protein